MTVTVTADETVASKTLRSFVELCGLSEWQIRTITSATIQITRSGDPDGRRVSRFLSVTLRHAWRLRQRLGLRSALPAKLVCCKQLKQISSQRFA